MVYFEIRKWGRFIKEGVKISGYFLNDAVTFENDQLLLSNQVTIVTFKRPVTY